MLCTLIQSDAAQTEQGLMCIVRAQYFRSGNVKPSLNFNQFLNVKFASQIKRLFLLKHFHMQINSFFIQIIFDLLTRPSSNIQHTDLGRS